jgi:subtilisin family serine protease/plastocyanin
VTVMNGPARRLAAGLAGLVAAAGLVLPGNPAAAAPTGPSAGNPATGAKPTPPGPPPTPATGSKDFGAAADAGKPARYLVRLSDAPLATYAGGVSGLTATRVPQGAKLSPDTAGARAYRSYLDGRRDAVVGKAKVKVRQTFDTTFNGFVADLSAAQADTLRHTAGVSAVYADTTVHIQTSNTSKELGLAGRGGVWDEQFDGDQHAGEGVIIGVIDSGYWPESPSFAAMSEPRPDRRTIAAKWHGTCDFGTAEPARCNNKVIGARWFDSAGLSTINPSEFKSPRDSNGHGTHTASTAAGRSGVKATVDGLDLGKITGMAPAARLAIYKALWSDGAGGAVGSAADIVSAIDAAVSDGVDVISYSVGDDSEYWSPVEEAFFNAAAAGVFVSAAAGNAGPSFNTVDNTEPWVTTVAATEQDKRYLRTITLGNGRTYIGAGTKSAQLVDAADVGNDPVDPVYRYWAELCWPGTLDPARTAGKIVLCQRGENGRAEKGDVVAAAGGAGMILYQPEWDPNTGVADLQKVPTAHVDVPTGGALLAYVKTPHPTAKLSAGVFTKVEAPSMAGFSSSGPSALSAGDLLKPDIAAPGVDVAAAFSPAEGGESFALESGTSMATPHIAGIAALVKAKHPGWSPAAIRSALMTGSRDRTDKGNPIREVDHAGSPLNYGAGEVRPAESFDPGLVYDSTPDQWLQWLCGVSADHGSDLGLALTGCDDIGTMPATELNYPSVSFGHLIGTQSVTRTVTNVGNRTSRYTARVQAPAGYSVKVSPSSFEVKPGKSVRFTVTVTHSGGAYGQWVSGNLTWHDNQGHDVRIPLVLTNTDLVAPATLSGTGSTGSQAMTVRTGFGGTLNLATAGLTSGTSNTFSLAGHSAGWDDTLPGVPNPLPANMAVKKVHVPAGTVGSTIKVDSQYGRCSDDEDNVSGCGEFYARVFDAKGDTVAADFMHLPHTSTLTLPDGAGDYTLVVEQIDLEGGVDSQNYTWTVFTPGASGSGTGKFTVDPARRSVTPGSTVKATVRWSGLEAGKAYRGVLVVTDGHGVRREIPVDVAG